jgi:hypothetical protein
VKKAITGVRLLIGGGTGKCLRAQSRTSGEGEYVQGAQRDGERHNQSDRLSVDTVDSVGAGSVAHLSGRQLNEGSRLGDGDQHISGPNHVRVVVPLVGRGLNWP